MKIAYAVPHDLFPERAVIEALASHGTSAFEQEIRALALKGFDTKGIPDKELQRFIKPAVSWSSWIGHEESEPLCSTLGDNSWLASPQVAPFIPEECKELITKLYSEPRSLLHLVGATFARMRIMYLADDLEKIPLQEIQSLPACELLMIVVAPGVTVSLSDELVTDQVYARSILGLLSEGAHVTLIADHSYASDAYSLQHDRWYLSKGATLTCGEVHTGGSQSWLRKEFKLAECSEVSYSWLAALRGDEQAVLTTVQEHEGSSSKSSVLVKTALSERSKSFYRGTIRINDQGSQSEADQQQKALMLSPEAKTCAIPSLEVATHDVQCAHGSAAGRFSEDELQYLKSRGLGTEQAQRVLIEGFFNEPFLQGSSMLSRLKEHVNFGE